MEPEFKTSFIPKKTLSPTKHTRGTVVGIFFVLALVIFLGSLLLGVGVFFYKTYLERSNTAKLDRLNAAREAVEPELIRSLERLDIRLKSSEKLLDSHRALSEFFKFLQASTLQSVQFEDFKYAEKSPSEIAITMTGKAKSFSSIALQSDTFAASGVIKAPLFSNFDLDDQGSVTFNFEGVLEPAKIKYAPIPATPIESSEASATSSADVSSDQTQNIDVDLGQIEKDLNSLEP